MGLMKQVVRPVEHSLWVRELLGICFPMCLYSGCRNSLSATLCSQCHNALRLSSRPAVAAIEEKWDIQRNVGYTSWGGIGCGE
jgi:hypothetical protein